MQTQFTMIRAGWPSVEDVLEIAKAGTEGELRLHELAGTETEATAAGQVARIRPGWWIEVCRGGIWSRHSGPFGWSQINGAPPQQALEALKMAIAETGQ